MQNHKRLCEDIIFTKKTATLGSRFSL